LNDASGNTVVLSDPHGRVLDRVTLPPGIDDGQGSFGRCPDGTGYLQRFEPSSSQSDLAADSYDPESLPRLPPSPAARNCDP
jgi:hypothetical protein